MFDGDYVYINLNGYFLPFINSGLTQDYDINKLINLYHNSPLSKTYGCISDEDCYISFEYIVNGYVFVAILNNLEEFSNLLYEDEFYISKCIAQSVEDDLLGFSRVG